MNTYVIDRFEDELAVLEDENGATATVLRMVLPPDAKEGDVVRLENGAYAVDQGETARRRDQALSLLRRLRGRK